MQLRSIAIMACLVLASRADPVLTALQKYTINGKVPVLCMTFDDAGFKDSSPEGNDGTPAGGVAATTGLSSGAMRFDNDWITSPSPSGLPIGNEARTISFWAKETTTGSYRGVVSYGSNTSHGRFDILIKDGDDIYIGLNGRYAYTTTDVVSLNEWNFITVTYDGTLWNTTALRIYVNGEAQTKTMSSSAELTTGSAYLFIGSEWNNAFRWIGSIDEVLIYNKSLSSSEVEIIYNIGKAGVR